ncbi:MAG: protease inhibitor I42 family protein [Lentisphaerae bacterium]|nr:protease inhibitor I42 family protein [Lentisphaerota bacterium]
MINPGLLAALCLTQSVGMSESGSQIRFFAAAEAAGDGIPQTSILVAEPGEIFTIRLEANATTGYQWALKNIKAQDVCLLLSSEYEPSDSGLAGAGGFQVWTFAALERGDATLEFEYLRPWETGAEPAQKHTACVVVW